MKMSTLLLNRFDTRLWWVLITKRVENCTPTENTYFINLFFAIFHSQWLWFILYFRDKEIILSISTLWQICTIDIIVYRVSQEERARLREGVPYVKVYRYNPKHLCPKLNGYGDNGQRKVWSSGGSMHCTCQLTSLIDVCPWVWCPMTESYVVGLYQNAQSAMLRQCLPCMCHV